MNFYDDAIEAFTTNHTSNQSDLLAELERQTYLTTINPRMISGRYQGRVLSLLSKMICPKCVVEFGTFTGYSALCLAEGLANDGKLITIDKNRELEEFTKSYIKRSLYSSNIELWYGDALALIDDLPNDIDLLFLDADKKRYRLYYQRIFDKISKGGYILVDNVLWSGKVVQEIDEKDIDTVEAVAFSKMIQDDERVENVLLPIRDGLMVVRKT